MSKKYKYIILASMIIVTGISLGFMSTFFQCKKPDPLIKEEPGISEIALQTPKTTTPQTVIVYITKHSNCDHIKRNEELIDPELVGLSEKEYLDLVEDWQVVVFSPGEIVLERLQSGVCDEHYFIGIQGGYITLFQGAPGLNSKVIEQTEIIADKLRKEDREMLERGLVIFDKDEYLRIREGLTH